MDANEQINKFKEFIESNYYEELLEIIRKDKKVIVIDFSELAKFDHELADLLLDEPEEVIKAAEIAVDQFDLQEKNIKIRFNSLPELKKLLVRNIRSKHLGKFFYFEGVVRQKSDVRPQVTSAKFECPSCGNIINVLQLDQKMREPSRCGCGRKGKFKMLSKELIDAQRLVLEEIPEDIDSGAQPKRMSVFLKEDLVSPLTERYTNPGSRVLVTGYVKEVPIIGRDGGKLTRFDLMIEANYIAGVQEDFYEIEISEEEEIKIKEIAKDPKVYEHIVNSVAPSIYGHDKIKEAIAYQLVGGVKKTRGDGVRTRGDVHVLLLGDPGSGKSQLLKRVSKIAPKARFVSGKGVSGAGLTAAVVRDEFLNGWSLEAGALPLSNNGFCLSGDTEIYMADHSLIKIEDIYDRFKKWNRKQEVFYLNPKTYEYEKANVINVSKRTVDKVYSIETDTQQKIIATAEHPFARWDNGLKWTNVSDLEVGNCLFVPRHFPINCKNDPKNNLFYLLGLIATDGHLSKKKYVTRFYTTSKELKSDFEELCLKVFEKKAGVSRDKRSESYQIHISSKNIHGLINSYGIPIGDKTKNKIIADKIINSGIEEIKSFMVGIINGDGSVSNRKGGGIIDIISGNKENVILYQKLLRKLGIISRTHKINSKGGGVVKMGDYTQYKLSITGISNIKLLYDERLISHKKEALDKIINRLDNSWKIPKISNILKKLNKTIPWFEKNILYANNIRLSRIKEDSCVTRLSLINAFGDLKLCNPAKKTNEFDEINKILENQIIFPKIKGIKEINRKTEVYNIQIDKKDNPNFVANFLVVHNCMIDEMDKMSPEDTSAMHEALEGQTITISKANIQATLRCETTVLAAANPKFGRFDPYDIIAKQINMPPALINRFDLIFPIKDLPDKTKDNLLADHILKLHKAPDTENPEIDTDLLKKYISYVRQNSNPKLSDEAMEELKKYYVEMRNSGSEEGGVKSVPISARQLEALVRLAEAAAKLRLAEEVTKKDAQRGIDMLHYCLSQIGIDPETGKIDIDRIATGISSSQRNHIITVKEIITELENKIGKTIPIDDVVTEAKSKGVEEDKVEEVLEKLKRSGDIFEPRRGFVQKI